MPLTDGHDWITEARDLQAEQDLARRSRGSLALDEDGGRHFDEFIGEVEREIDLAMALEHRRRLNESPAINPDAEQRRQEALARNLREIQRLMAG